MKEPCLRVQELTAQAQALINSHKGIKTQLLREALGVNVGMFRHVTPRLKCIIERDGRSFVYHPGSTYIAPKPPDMRPEARAALTIATDKIQRLIDVSNGINSLQIRIELGMSLQYFKKAVVKIEAYRSRSNGIMTYYKTEPKPVPPPKPVFTALTFTPGEPNRTIWRTATPWECAA